jgi:glycosyltransferase involved in cell wall biosynthesis
MRRSASWSSRLGVCETVLTTVSDPSPAEHVTTALAVSVIICTYTQRRWEALLAVVASVGRQTHPALETIVVIDHNSELLEQALAELTDVRVIASEHAPGLSGTRNTGVERAVGDVIAFLDDDAVTDGTRLEELARAYDDPNVVGAGGVARPRWVGGKAPRWLPQFYWTVGCSYRGLPTGRAPIRNPIGASMSFRRTIFDRIEGLVTGIRRVGRTPLGCEETELSIRARRVFPGRVVLHFPSARVEHIVPERVSWCCFRSHCWAEGLSKSLLSRRVGNKATLRSEHDYVLGALPSGMLCCLTNAMRGDSKLLARACPIAARLLVTVAGYPRSRLARAR